MSKEQFDKSRPTPRTDELRRETLKDGMALSFRKAIDLARDLERDLASLQDEVAAHLTKGTARSSTPHNQGPTQRWNVEERDDGVYICKGLHEKNEGCRFERHTPVSAIAPIRACLQWCVDHDGECLGDHQGILASCIEALKNAPSLQEQADDELRMRLDHPSRVTDAMVDRFLSWKLPQDFSPDSGIVFKPHPHPNAWPIGTNLLTAVQTRAMLEHVLKGDTPPSTTRPIDREAILFAAAHCRNHGYQKQCDALLAMLGTTDDGAKTDG